MNKELLYTFFQGKTTLDEEVRIREWMESTPENYRTFLEERKLFDAMILLADEKRLLSKRNQFKLLVSTWGKEIGKIAAVAIITLVMTLTSQYIFNNTPAKTQCTGRTAYQYRIGRWYGGMAEFTNQHSISRSIQRERT